MKWNKRIMALIVGASVAGVALMGAASANASVLKMQKAVDVPGKVQYLAPTLEVEKGGTPGVPSSGQSRLKQIIHP
ncbi:hypothetical protein JK635_08010 [Neobacillus sp. YIM B02564]|uniref:Uncharacterized protein n=1 Tax=Neobacillus paridis TaxID=2803862 RepID=A0ABS1TQI4_9BACI|nr:hypothetical protein [Neobacillus paridis]MBL4952155.1 hypothetical protein [Neobacillus paridis]